MIYLSTFLGKETNRAGKVYTDFPGYDLVTQDIYNLIFTPTGDKGFQFFRFMILFNLGVFDSLFRFNPHLLVFLLFVSYGADIHQKIMVRIDRFSLPHTGVLIWLGIRMRRTSLFWKSTANHPNLMVFRHRGYP